MVDGNHQRFVPDRLEDVPPEVGRGFIPDETGNLLGFGVSQADLRVEMCFLEVRSGWDLVQQ